MITVDHLTKRYNTVTAVDDLSFEVGPGRVTGFLGPNGAGKTTTLRMLLGLARPDGGTATIDGVRYRNLPHPARTVGAALEADCFHPARSAAEHLRIVASAAGIPRSRVRQVLGLTDLAEARHRRVGGFSLGMRQRLTLAAVLLGDPAKTAAIAIAGVVLAGLTFARAWPPSSWSWPPTACTACRPAPAGCSPTR